MTPVPASKTSVAVSTVAPEASAPAGPARPAAAEAPPRLRPVGPAAAPDRRKQSVYFPAGMLREIEAQARRLERPVSWLLQLAWRLARERISQAPPGERTAPGGGDGGEAA